MYLELMIISLLILVYSVISGKIENLPLSAPILFMLSGVIAGPLVLNLFSLKLNSELLKLLVELALALVLFTDASKTNLKRLEHNIKFPARLLLIGLPLTVALGTVSGYLVFNGLTWLELAILATMLAPTDAALGKAVVTNPKVPSRIREALNVESGLNDGICVPVLYLLIAVAEAQTISDISLQFGLGLFLREIGVGMAVGIGLTFLGDRLVQYCIERKWIMITWKPVVIVALAFSVFALAQTLGGSGFIACFTGGVLFGSINKQNKPELLYAAEGAADSLSLVTWFLFGALVIDAYLPYFNQEIIIYALLSLTLIRMIPILISLIGSGINLKQQVFIGWFGPRGLASIVFAIIVLDIDFPNQETIIPTVVCTILLSVLAHGFSANPLVRQFYGKPSG